MQVMFLGRFSTIQVAAAVITLSELTYYHFISHISAPLEGLRRIPPLMARNTAISRAADRISTSLIK